MKRALWLVSRQLFNSEWIAASQRTHFKTENDPNKPHNESEKTSLGHFKRVSKRVCDEWADILLKLILLIFLQDLQYVVHQNAWVIWPVQLSLSQMEFATLVTKAQSNRVWWLEEAAKCLSQLITAVSLFKYKYYSLDCYPLWKGRLASLLSRCH